MAGIIAALGGGAGLRALWGQGEEQIRQNARILAAVESLERAEEKREARIQAIEYRERVNWSRWETAHAMHFAAAAQQGYKPPREAPDATDQIRYAPTRNAKKPALASDQQGRALALPEAAEPPPGP